MIFIITGAAGFIGSNYLEIMVNKYHNDFFICFDKLTYAGDIQRLKYLTNKPNFIFVKGDICSKKCVSNIFKKYKVDYIVNFAAETHVDTSIKDPSIFFKTNVEGVVNLLNHAVKYKIKRFHQVSTDEVYGSTELDSTYQFKEIDILNPSNPYSSSKASADLIALAYSKTYGLDVTISRSSNNFGKNQNSEKLIPLVIEKALKNEHIPIYGNGLNVRDWIYVEDNCHAIDFIVRNGKKGEIYNVSTHNELSNIEIVHRILNYLGKSFDLIEHVEDRKAHDKRYALNTKKLAELGYNFENSNFNEHLKKTIEFYKGR